MAGGRGFASIEFTRRFDKSYARLPQAVQRQVGKALDRLVDDPAHPGLEVHPIKPRKTYWEAYVNRSDRLIYRPEGDTLYIIDVVQHDDPGRYG